MPALLTRTRTSDICLALGACSLRAAQLRDPGTGYRVHHWVNVEIEPVTPELPPFDHEGQLSRAFGPGTFSGSRTVLCLSPPDVEYRLIDAPAALLEKSPAELRSALAYELDRQMPWPAAQSEIAVWPIKPGEQGNTKLMVAAAQSSRVNEYLALLDRQKIQCVRADIAPNGLTRICSPLAEEVPSEPNAAPVWGVLDIGFRSARLYLIHGDRTIYARVMPGGGREITQKLAEALHIDFRIAEQYKRIYGIRISERGFRSTGAGLLKIDEDQLPSILYAILRPTLEQMARDIERSYRYALGQFQGATTGPVYLIGGGARMNGLIEAMTEHLGVPVRRPDPAWAFGAAMREEPRRHPAYGEADYPVLAACLGMAQLEGGRA